MDISDKIEAVIADTQLKSTYESHNVPTFLSFSFVLAYSPLRPVHLVNALDKLHAKHALPGFTDRTAEEREIEAVTAEITSVNVPLSFSGSPLSWSADIAYHCIEFSPLPPPYPANWFRLRPLFPSATAPSAFGCGQCPTSTCCKTTGPQRQFSEETTRVPREFVSFVPRLHVGDRSVAHANAWSPSL